MLEDWWSVFHQSTEYFITGKFIKPTIPIIDDILLACSKFLTDRYGDFILLKPPFNLNTLGLWFLPFIFLLLGIYIVLYHNKKSR